MPEIRVERLVYFWPSFLPSCLVVPTRAASNCYGLRVTRARIARRDVYAACSLCVPHARVSFHLARANDSNHINLRLLETRTHKHMNKHKYTYKHIHKHTQIYANIHTTHTTHTTPPLKKKVRISVETYHHQDDASSFTKRPITQAVGARRPPTPTFVAAEVEEHVGSGGLGRTFRTRHLGEKPCPKGSARGIRGMNLALLHRLLRVLSLFPDQRSQLLLLHLHPALPCLGRRERGSSMRNVPVRQTNERGILPQGRTHAAPFWDWA